MTANGSAYYLDIKKAACEKVHSSGFLDPE